VVEALKRSLFVDDFRGKSVDKICGCDECLIPKLEGHGGMG